MFVLLVFMLISWVFSLAYASVCVYGYACAYALMKSSLKRNQSGRGLSFPGAVQMEGAHTSSISERDERPHKFQLKRMEFRAFLFGISFSVPETILSQK